MSLMAAMGRPQLATGPQKCYGRKEKGREGEEESRRSCEQLGSLLPQWEPRNKSHSPELGPRLTSHQVESLPVSQQFLQGEFTARKAWQFAKA